MKENVQQLIRQLIKEIGENPEREGLVKTPERVSLSLTELTSGYRTDINNLLNGAFFEANYSEMVVVKDINFYSLCEHHMLPFFGKAHIAYIPDGKIIGLSKIPRLVNAMAKKLQIQERLTLEIAEILNEKLKPKGIGVVMEARHLCMVMRGVKNENSIAITSSMLGCFRKDPKTREEFLLLIKNGK